MTRAPCSATDEPLPGEAPGGRRKPARPARGTRKPGAADRPDLRPKPRVLLVEPDPLTAQLCGETLGQAGFVVETVETGLAAVVSARRQPPQLVMLDIQLPDVPGLQAITWLRSNPRLRTVPIIAMTVSAVSNAVMTRFAPLATLRKPLSHAGIRAFIAALFGASGTLPIPDYIRQG